MKAKLYDIFKDSPKPMTSAELWELAEVRADETPQAVLVVVWCGLSK